MKSKYHLNVNFFFFNIYSTNTYSLKKTVKKYPKEESRIQALFQNSWHNVSYISDTTLHRISYVFPALPFQRSNLPFNSSSICRLPALISDLLLLDCDGCRGLAFPLVLPLSPRRGLGSSPSAAASSVRWMMEVNRGQRVPCMIPSHSPLQGQTDLLFGL